MKKFFLLILLFTIPAFAADEMPVKADVESVKVFLNGAELTHEARVNISAGTTEIVFENVAQGIAPNSIQVSAKGDAVIMSVMHRNNYLKRNQKSPKVIALEDSLKYYERLYRMKENEKTVLQAEIDLIMANKNIGGENNGATIKQIEEMAKFMRKRLSEIRQDMLAVTVDQDEIRKRMERIKKQIDEITSSYNPPTDEVVVTASADRSTALDIELTYFTHQAGWIPAYDVKATDINSGLTIDYKAMVRQNTNIPWDNTDIVLSTRNPQYGAHKPVLNPWYVDFAKDYMNYRGGNAVKNQMMSKEKVAMDAIEEEAAVAAYMNFTASETQLSVEFMPKLTYSIPSDGKPHSVHLQNYEIAAEYEYYSAPKLVPEAFLVAKVSEWNKTNMLPGRANVYFNNSYVGETYIDPWITEKELLISFGADKGIKIERKQTSDYKDEAFFGNDVERTFAYDIIIKNNKSKAVSITVEDQLPIPQHEDIEVETGTTDGAEVDDKKGIVKWVLDIEPNQTVTKEFSYTVTYPSDKRIPGL